MNTALNSTVVIISTNKSGGVLSYGDVVIPSSAADRGVTTTTDTSLKSPVGVVVDPGGINTDGQGAIAWQGYVPRINLISAAARTDGLVISASAGKATVSASSSGDAFGMALSTGTTPDAVLFGRVPADPTPGYEIVGGRLTLTTDTPITTSDVTGAATLYYTPYTHGRIGLLYGGLWDLYETDEISVSLASLTDATNYDVFAYYTGSAVALELVAWASDTARATALVRQDGIWAKSGDTSRRYLGTIRASAAGACEDSDARRLVWNNYNRAPRKLKKIDGTSSWTVSVASWASANGSTANRVDLVVGLAESLVGLKVSVAEAFFGSATGAQVGIGKDSVTVNSADIYGSAASPSYNSIYAEIEDAPAVGYHYYQWLQRTDGSSVTFYATDGGGTRSSGMIGSTQA